LPKGVFYDPLTLSFVPKIDHIEAGKMKVNYEWSGERLRAIVPVFDKPEHATGERRISFAYEDKVPQVASVAYDEGARPPAGNTPDDILKSSMLMLFNNPLVDPIAIENLTGRSATFVVAGNRFFHPFVWDKIHYFRVLYDERGRVRKAWELPDPKGSSGDTVL